MRQNCLSCKTEKMSYEDFHASRRDLSCRENTVRSSEISEPESEIREHRGKQVTCQQKPTSTAKILTSKPVVRLQRTNIPNTSQTINCPQNSQKIQNRNVPPSACPLNSITSLQCVTPINHGSVVVLHKSCSGRGETDLPVNEESRKSILSPAALFLVQLKQQHSSRSQESSSLMSDSPGTSLSKLQREGDSNGMRPSDLHTCHNLSARNPCVIHSIVHRGQKQDARESSKCTSKLNEVHSCTPTINNKGCASSDSEKITSNSKEADDDIMLNQNAMVLPTAVRISPIQAHSCNSDIAGYNSDLRVAVMQALCALDLQYAETQPTQEDMLHVGSVGKQSEVVSNAASQEHLSSDGLSICCLGHQSEDQYSAACEKNQQKDVPNVGCIENEPDVLPSTACQENQAEDVPGAACQENQAEDVPGAACQENQAEDVPGTACQENQVDDVPGVACQENQAEDVPGAACQENQAEDVPGVACQENQAEDVPGTACQENQAEDVPGVACQENQAEDVPGTACQENQVDDVPGVACQENQAEDVPGKGHKSEEPPNTACRKNQQDERPGVVSQGLQSMDWLSAPGQAHQHENMPCTLSVQADQATSAKPVNSLSNRDLSEQGADKEAAYQRLQSVKREGVERLHQAHISSFSASMECHKLMMQRGRIQDRIKEALRRFPSHAAPSIPSVKDSGCLTSRPLIFCTDSAGSSTPSGESCCTTSSHNYCHTHLFKQSEEAELGIELSTCYYLPELDDLLDTSVSSALFLESYQCSLAHDHVLINLLNSAN
ncbi:hypothetical protein CEUSTIGMA_g11412.t1 [Chlamydomonas eustigma]|uniref:Uncharacterized protein n=1 Tax=Chlamydomonas eustigma TaxID=1157962 RepID=A0A250XLP1_9CHLO|nr:hypothetical protein CEUSTIGMA_g11412.t1 [Chlamydomonas eustigma]|eukprot:GAX83987.1 hypothetical protein CEUSTIGMA_g11412.t1 [Chlamydomonas eustigma]